MERQEVVLRSVHAHQFLEAAIDIRDLYGDRTNVSVSNAVLAGIAASDAICGRALGRRPAGENHKDAIELLKTATVNGPAYARDLARLLEMKTNSQYSPMTLTRASAEKAIEWATRLVGAMDELLRSA